MKPQNCKNILYKCFNLAPLNVTIFILFDKNPLWYLIYINLKTMSSNPMLIHFIQGWKWNFLRGFIKLKITYIVLTFFKFQKEYSSNTKIFTQILILYF